MALLGVICSAQVSWTPTNSARQSTADHAEYAEQLSTDCRESRVLRGLDLPRAPRTPRLISLLGVILRERVIRGRATGADSFGW